jgi:polysaccharide biosynthesis protein PslH
MIGKRRNILYLAHRVPHPPNRGDRIRSFHLLEFLAARADVHLAFLAEETPTPESMDVLEKLCARVAAVTLGRRSRWATAAWSLATGRTATEGLFQSRTLKQTIAAWARETRFDLVVVFCSSMMQYVDVAELEGVPLVVDLVDVDSQKWFDYGATASGLKRLLFQLEGRRLRQLERELSRRAKAITLVSESEANLYRSFCDADSIHAVPNGVDLDYFRPWETPSESGICVFVGALDYRANLEGIEWFCDRAWPLIHARCPNTRLKLVGSNPGAGARRLAFREGVELIGEVPDVRPYVAEADIAIIPLRIARGIQNKVIEALAMGKAVVATPQAIEGLAACSGEHLLEAATPEAWCDAVCRLLSDADERARLGRAGREYVEQFHRWETHLAPFGRLAGLEDLEYALDKEAT